MKKILIVLGNYLPNMSANGVCCKKIVDELRLRGCEVAVVSNEQCGVKGETEYEGVKQYLIRNTLLYRLRIFLKNTRTGIKKKLFPLFDSLLGKICFVLSAISFPIGAFSYERAIYKRVRKLHKKTKFDVIVGVNFPTDAASAVCRLKKKTADFLCVTYFLDPILEGRAQSLLSQKAKQRKAIRVEERILERSDVVVAQKEHREHYKGFYGDRFDSKIKYLGVPLLVDRPCVNAEKADDKKTVVYAGSLFPDIRNPEYIINVFKKLRDVRLDIYTAASREWLSELVGEAENIKIHSAVPYSEIEKIMSAADALLNIGNSYASAAPSKLIEYLNYRKPVITTVKTEGDKSVLVLGKYPLSLILDERETGVDEAASRIENLLSCEVTEIDFGALKELYYEETPAAFADLIVE